MPDITLHDLDEKTYASIRRAAEDEDLSLNQVIKRALRNAAREDAFRGDVVRESFPAVWGDAPATSLALDPELLDRARAVARSRGTSVAALVTDFLKGLAASAGASRPRTLGVWEGRMRIAEDFDTLPDDIAAAFGMLDGGVS